MSNYDNGYLKAQREYDNQLPPEAPDDVECPDCEGTGKLQQSNCCGANVDSDILICSDCKEHCDLDECERCEGTGNVNIEKEKQQAYEEWLERKADEARDEIEDRKIGSDLDRFLGNKEV